MTDKLFRPISSGHEIDEAAFAAALRRAFEGQAVGNIGVHLPPHVVGALGVALAMVLNQMRAEAGQ